MRRPNSSYLTLLLNSSTFRPLYDISKTSSRNTQSDLLKYQDNLPTRGQPWLHYLIVPMSHRISVRLDLSTPRILVGFGVSGPLRLGALSDQDYSFGSSVKLSGKLHVASYCCPTVNKSSMEEIIIPREDTLTFFLSGLPIEYVVAW